MFGQLFGPAMAITSIDFHMWQTIIADNGPIQIN